MCVFDGIFREFRTASGKPTLVTNLHSIVDGARAVEFCKRINGHGPVRIVGWLEKQTAQVVQELILNRLDVVVSANFNGPLSSEADYPLGGWDEVAGAERIRKLLEGDSYTEIKPVGGNSGEHRDQWCHEFVRLGQFKNVAAFVVTPDKVGLTALMKGLGGFPTRCVNNFWEALRLSERQTITMGEEATYTMDAMVRRQNALLALVQEAFQSMDPQDAIARIESGSWASWDQIEQS